jgi:hypothetical protein
VTRCRRGRDPVKRCDRDQLKKLNVGYSDDVSVFLNDKILYRGRSARRFRDPGFLGSLNPDNDVVYLPLTKGPNELMLAVSELTGGWGFICRFDNMDGNLLRARALPRASASEFLAVWITVCDLEHPPRSPRFYPWCRRDSS